MNQLNENIRTSLRMKIFLALINLLIFIMTPISVFWDSYLYLGSSSSLFTDNFLENYHWVREPGYPLFIKITTSLMGAEGQIFCQYILSWLGVIFFIDSLKHVFKTNRESKALYLAGIFSLALSAGYASSVLQQIFFIFTVSATMNLIIVPRTAKRKIILAILIGLLSSLVSVILFSGILTIFFFYFVITAVLNRRNVNQAITLILVVFLTGSVVTGSWYSFKSGQDQTKRIYQDAWNFWEFENTWEYQDDNPIKRYAYRISEVPSVIFALNQFGVETTYSQKGLVSGETQTFVANKFSSDSACGRYLPGPAEYIERSQLQIPSFCRNAIGLSMVNFIHLILSPAIPLFGLASFMVILYAPFLYGASVTFMILIPMMSLSPYILSSAGASRYGAPQLIFAPLLISMWLQSRKKNEENPHPHW